MLKDVCELDVNDMFCFLLLNVFEVEYLVDSLLNTTAARKK